MTEIDERAFCSAYRPEAVTLPKSLKTIGKEAFFYASDIFYAGTTAQWKKILIGENAFYEDDEDGAIVCSDGTLELS